MTPTDYLFRIIHSLTPAEKRYFKIFASRHVIGTKNNYERLFDEYEKLDALQPYDEAAFKASLKGKSWLKNFAVEKKLLEDAVLRAMRSFHSEKTEEGKLADALADIEFLFNKGVTESATRLLQKAFEMAYAIENLPALVTLFDWKLRLTRITQTIKEVDEANADFEEEKRVLRMLELERNISHTRRTIYNLYISGKLSSQLPKFRQQLEAFNSGGVDLTVYSKFSLTVSTAIVEECSGNYNGALASYEQVIDLFATQAEKLSRVANHYRTLLSNYLACAHYAERFDLFLPVLKKIQAIKADSLAEQLRILMTLWQYNLLYHLNVAGSDHSMALVREIETGLKKYKALIPFRNHVNFRFNICLLHLRKGNYTELLKSIAELYDVVGRDKTMNTILRDLKIMELMAHFSLDNFDVADYQVKNLERWLRENKLSNDFLAAVLKLFKANLTAGKMVKANGQLAETNCPPDLVAMKELIVDWSN
ncbi:MAG: hypothetical protein U0V74_08290 [Chitinophagales bacterium]